MLSVSYVWLFVTPWTVAWQGPLSTRFSRWQYWRVLHSSKGSSQPRDWTQVSCIAGGFFTIWALNTDLLESILSVSSNKRQSSWEVFLPMKSYGGSGFLGLPWTQHMAELLLKGTSAHRRHNTWNEGQLGRSFSLGELLFQSLWSELRLLGQSMKLDSTFCTPGFSGSLTTLGTTHNSSLSLIGVSDGVVVQEERSWTVGWNLR